MLCIPWTWPADTIKLTWTPILLIPWISLERPVLRLLSSPIWSIYCPLVLQQDLACCGSSPPYLDDFLFLSKLKLFSHEQSIAFDRCEAAGLSINDAKSHLKLTRRLTHLGFVVDLDLLWEGPFFRPYQTSFVLPPFPAYITNVTDPSHNTYTRGLRRWRLLALHISFEPPFSSTCLPIPDDYFMCRLFFDYSLSSGVRHF